MFVRCLTRFSFEPTLGSHWLSETMKDELLHDAHAHWVSETTTDELLYDAHVQSYVTFQIFTQVSGLRKKMKTLKSISSYAIWELNLGTMNGIMNYVTVITACALLICDSSEISRKLTAPQMIFSSKDFFSKCEQITNFLWIFVDLPKSS